MRSELEKIVREEIKQKLVSSLIRKVTLSSLPIESEISQKKLISLANISTIDKDQKPDLTLK